MTKPDFEHLKQLAAAQLFPHEAKAIVETIDLIILGEQTRCACCYNWVTGDIIALLGFNKFSDYPKTFVLCEKCHFGAMGSEEKSEELRLNTFAYLGKEPIK